MMFALIVYVRFPHVNVQIRKGYVSEDHTGPEEWTKVIQIFERPSLPPRLRASLTYGALPVSKRTP